MNLDYNAMMYSAFPFTNRDSSALPKVKVSKVFCVILAHRGQIYW